MKKFSNIKSYILIVIAISFIAIGVARGDYNEVFNKAKMICFECIGIG